MKFVIKIGDIIFLQCDKCKTLASDEEEIIKESCGEPINYIKLLDFIGREEKGMNFRILRLILTFR